MFSHMLVDNLMTKDQRCKYIFYNWNCK
jgi:hypothetical protein